MNDIVSVITPAFRAEPFLPSAARSVIAQTYPHWQHWIISDDGVDYEAVLRREGLFDPRQRFLSSGVIGGGASRARNLALDTSTAPIAAILDADDRLLPAKLHHSLSKLALAPIVSTALDVQDEAGKHLRFVGKGPDFLLSPGDYKFVGLSMDSMLVWDRRVTDARYDITLTNMTDLELLLQLWRKSAAIFHLGTPLHAYVKLGVSMSNGPGVTEKMIRSKRTILDRLKSGYYPLADPSGVAGLAQFLEISLKAEAAFPAALAANPGLLFEDHLEPLLRAARS